MQKPLRFPTQNVFSAGHEKPNASQQKQKVVSKKTKESEQFMHAPVKILKVESNTSATAGEEMAQDSRGFRAVGKYMAKENTSYLRQWLQGSKPITIQFCFSTSLRTHILYFFSDFWASCWHTEHLWASGVCSCPLPVYQFLSPPGLFLRLPKHGQQILAERIDQRHYVIRI